MRQSYYRAGLGFPFPEDSSSLDVLRTLKRWARYQPALDSFPWHLAGRLHYLLCDSRPEFAFAELTLFVKGEAARRIFEPSLPGYHRRMLAGLLKHRPQIGGILYEHLRYQVKGSIIRRGIAAWPDCEGVSPLGYGDRMLEPAEIEEHRRSLLALIMQALRWYERTLAMIGNSDNLDGRACGHELHHWIGGANMPDEVLVPVLAEQDGDALLMAPDKREAKIFIDSGWPIPEYRVDAGDFDLKPKPRPVPIPEPAVVPAPPPAAPHIAAARMLQSGLLLSAGPLLDQMKPAERELANYLLSYKHPDKRIPLSYAEIGRMLGCSDESIRRRQRALERRHPPLKRLIAAARSRNRKGASPAPGVGREALDPAPESR